MATFETARLYGGRDCKEFEAADGEVIRVWFHHAQPEEIALAMHAAGLTQKGDTITARGAEGDDLLTASKLIMANVELARLCIDEMENYDHWQNGSSHTTGPHGLTMLTDEIVARIPRVVLRDVGSEIFAKSKPSEDEKKD